MEPALETPPASAVGRSLRRPLALVGRQRDAAHPRSHRGARPSEPRRPDPRARPRKEHRPPDLRRARRSSVGGARARRPLRPRHSRAQARLEHHRAPDRDGLPHRRCVVPGRARRDDCARGRGRRRIPLHRDGGDIAARAIRHAHRVEVAGVRVGERPCRPGKPAGGGRDRTLRRADADHADRAPPRRDARAADHPRRGSPQRGGRELGRDRDGAVRRIGPGDERRRHHAGGPDDADPRSRVTPERHETVVACLRKHGSLLSELVGWLPGVLVAHDRQRTEPPCHAAATLRVRIWYNIPRR